jgi:hypothetical protein
MLRRTFFGFCVLLTLILSLPVGLAHAQTSSLTIKGPNNETNPVVTVGGQLQLHVVNSVGATISVNTWTSDNLSIARVSASGVLRGNDFGFALITAFTAQGTASCFATVIAEPPPPGPDGDSQTDSAGNVWLTSPTQHRVYKTSALGSFIVAGDGVAGHRDGPGTQARFNTPTGITRAPNNGMFIADTGNHCIRKIDAAYNVTTRVGSPGFPGTMTANIVPISAAMFRAPQGVEGTGTKDFYVADTENHCIWYVNFTANRVELVCGEPGLAGFVDGTGRNARFYLPTNMTLNSNGTLLMVADGGNNVIRSVSIYTRADGTRYGVVTTLGA